MSKKILITTDLSVNSRAGIRFGIQFAEQAGFSIVFYHALQIDKPTRWSDTRFENYVSNEIKVAKEQLERFVRAIYKDEGVVSGKYRIVVERAASAQEGIIRYGTTKGAAYICMSTRGAGKVRRILGTNTSYIIKHSPIPVFAIPKNYKTTPIEHILYASDLDAISSELKKVKKFADSVQSQVTVLHYDYLYRIQEVQDKFDKVAKRERKPGVQFHLERFNIENSLGVHLKNAVRKFNPSLVVLFTRQNRDWFERLFLPSESASVAFDSKCPLLIYGKKQIQLEGRDERMMQRESD